MTFKKPTRAGLVALALGVLFALFLSMSVIDRSYAEDGTDLLTAYLQSRRATTT